MRLVFILHQIPRTILDSFIGLTDRANNNALRAHESNAGIKDISCNYHFACDDVFEWEIKSSPEMVDQVMSVDMFSSQDSLVTDMAAYFASKLAASYAELIFVTFIERVEYSNGLCGLKFRAQCSEPILETERRTEILRYIQLAYYQLIPLYYVSVSQNANVPSDCVISPSGSIIVVTKNIGWDNSVHAPVVADTDYPTTQVYPTTQAYPSNQGYPQCSCSTYTQQYDLQQLEQTGTTVETVCSDTIPQLQAALQEFYSETPVQTSYTVTQTETSATVVYNVVYNCDQPVATVTSSGETITIAVNGNPEKAKIDQSIQCG